MLLLELLDSSLLLSGFAFAGGLFSSSSRSTQQTTNVYETENTNIGASEGGIAARDSTVTLIDAGAFKLGEAALKESFKFVGDAIGKSAEQTTSALTKFQEQARESLGNVVTLATKQNTDAVQQLTENVFKYGMLALVTLGGTAAVYAFATRKKK